MLGQAFIEGSGRRLSDVPQKRRGFADDLGCIKTHALIQTKSLSSIFLRVHDTPYETL
jgi:hypothetical protein